MKRKSAITLVVASFLVFVAGVAVAQQQPTPPQGINGPHVGQPAFAPGARAGQAPPAGGAGSTVTVSAPPAGAGNPPPPVGMYVNWFEAPRGSNWAVGLSRWVAYLALGVGATSWVRNLLR